jgi:hypothetical protein
LSGGYRQFHTALLYILLKQNNCAINLYPKILFEHR